MLVMVEGTVMTTIAKYSEKAVHWVADCGHLYAETVRESKERDFERLKVPREVSSEEISRKAAITREIQREVSEGQAWDLTFRQRLCEEINPKILGSNTSPEIA